jgi:pimeloyl-ACP methyl ester carboxylesterase
VPIAAAPDGASIAYETRGDGLPLVLVHGITECRRSWDPLITPLARDHRVIAVDLRGHGQSERRPPYDALTMAADVHAVAEAAGATQPCLVGHSLGGSVVSLYAAAYPARGVVNVDQPLELSGFKELLAPIEPMLRGDEATFQSVMQEIFASLYGALSEEERARVALHAHPEQDVVLGVWELVLTSSANDLDALMRGALAAVAAPYLALHGEDPGDGYARWLQSALPVASLEIWPGLGHYPHLVEPERFVDRVRRFTAET